MKTHAQVPLSNKQVNKWVNFVRPSLPRLSQMGAWLSDYMNIPRKPRKRLTDYGGLRTQPGEWFQWYDPGIQEWVWDAGNYHYRLAGMLIFGTANVRYYNAAKAARGLY